MAIAIGSVVAMAGNVGEEPLGSYVPVIVEVRVDGCVEQACV
jgi:hypothetical protein